MRNKKESTPSTPEMAFEERLRSTLQKPEFKGRVNKHRELYRDMNISHEHFRKMQGAVRAAQIFLQENAQAPLEVKEHYKKVLDKTFTEGVGPTAVKVNGKTHTVTKEEVVQVARRIGMGSGRSERKIAEVIEPKIVSKTEVVTEEEMIIDRIRRMYVLADAGEMPGIGAIMRDVGLIDKDGKYTSKVTEEMVRDRMIADEWRNERSDHLKRTFDIIPEEVKIYRTLSGIEREKKMQQEFNVIHNLNQQYFAKGKVMSLDKTRELDWKADLGALSIIAETIRRSAQDGGPAVAIQINNLSSGGSQTAQASISQASKAFMQKLNKMNPEELMAEADKLDAMVKMLAPPEKKITINDIATQDSIDLMKAQKKEE